MRHSDRVKNRVINLREKGFSLGQIYEKTHVPKTTIRLWIKNILLSEDQRETLRQRTQDALQKGRVQSQSREKKERLQEEQMLFEKAGEQTKKLTRKELFVVGVALYWGEGFKNKYEHRLGFCNSDPGMISFYITWLKESLGVKNEDLIARVTINDSYQAKTKVIEKYWSNTTGIPLHQFTKTFYQHSQWKKQHESSEYYGVLRIHVRESLEYLWKMKGWIAGLKHAKISNTRQGSSVVRAPHS